MSTSESLSFNPVDNERLARLCGPLDENLKQVETGLDVAIQRRGEAFRVQGPAASWRWRR
ncbi:PhoH-like protein [Chromobacterium violaceum]|uniref:PhoH-like protein n=1 Tax=Chromobacterium violaceum TaxID=536 RepID=A0A3S4LM12_CHRVL|nr:PhoH-like protein [Chromobacterium violaceum]